jgi:tetratricopeptide (TPR) repeat protein
MIRAAAVMFLACAANGQTVGPGWEHFYNLDYDGALVIFEQQAEREPENPNLFNHIAQTVLYREMYRAGALESELVSGSNPFLRRERLAASESAQRQFDGALAKAMTLAQSTLAKSPNNIPALYALGVSHGLRGNYNFLVRKAWRDALRDATAARKLHNKVVELDPSFVDAQLVQGVHDYVVGSLPWHWKLLGFIAGFRGDKEQGIRTLRLVSQKGNVNRYDAQVLLAAIYRRERRPLDALPLLKPLAERFPRNYLFRLEMVQMYSDAGKKQDALNILAEVERLKRSGSPGYARLPIEKIFYYRGNLLFWYRDFDAAIDQLRRVTPRTDSLDLHTAVMAWMRLGQTLDMTGRREQAIEAYKQAIAVAPESEAARESRNYLDSPYRRRT